MQYDSPTGKTNYDVCYNSSEEVAEIKNRQTIPAIFKTK